MGRIAEVLSSRRTSDEGGHGLDVVCDPGGGANITAPHFACPGDDSAPLPGDYAALEDSSGTGAEQCTGYADVRNAGVALPGEKRIYARDTGGDVVAVIYLKRNGDVVINGAVISPAGEVTAKTGTPTSVTLTGHIHSTPFGPSSPPTAGT